MGAEGTSTRTYVDIDGREYLLGQELDLVEVVSRIETAARSEPTFVELSDRGDLISVLISQRSRVVITVRQESPQRHAFESSDGEINDWEL